MSQQLEALGSEALGILGGMFNDADRFSLGDVIRVLNHGTYPYVGTVVEKDGDMTKIKLLDCPGAGQEIWVQTKWCALCASSTVDNPPRQL